MNNALDILAIVLWILAVLFPVFSLIFVWRRFKNMNAFYRILTGLVIGAGVGLLLFWIGISIVFRNGIKLF